MIKAIAFSRAAYAQARRAELDLLRAALVTGCALALILAGQPLPL